MNSLILLCDSLCLLLVMISAVLSISYYLSMIFQSPVPDGFCKLYQGYGLPSTALLLTKLLGGFCVEFLADLKNEPLPPLYMGIDRAFWLLSLICVFIRFYVALRKK